MPRRVRLILPGFAVHLIQRGHNRQACFKESSDYFVYLMHLREQARDFSCEVHAYCLMTNHVHLLLTPPTADACSVLMKRLGQYYAQYFNRHHGRTGTLWEGRYRSCITESARYVLACYRYIEMNPVRAGMVAAPNDYAWSSHSHNAGHKANALVIPHSEYLALGSSTDARHRAYLGLFESAVDVEIEEIRRATNGGYPLASEHFKGNLGVEDRLLRPRRPGPPAGV